MLRDRHARRNLVTFIVLVALSAVMFALADTRPVQELRNGVRFAMGPIQEALGDGTRSLTSVLDAISEVDQLRLQNDELSLEVQRLNEELAGMEALRAEVDNLEELLGTRDRLTADDIETVAAGVSARQFTQFERVITLDRGAEADVRVGAPVLSSGGALLGRVIDVGEGWSDVMLISDSNFLVAGLDRRTKATGNVIGRLSAPLSMTEVKRSDKMSENDLIVTLGAQLGGGIRSVYPPGIPIGRVVDIIDAADSIVKSALLVPVADLEHIEHALVMTNFRPPRKSKATDEGAG
jgi:rod shape-determining protein MreC